MNLFEGGGGNSILVNIIEVPEGKQFYRAFGPFWFSSVVQITDVLRKHAARLEEISFLLSADVHRLINDEAMVSPPYWEAVLPVRRERSEIPPPSFIPPLSFILLLFKWKRSLLPINPCHVGEGLLYCVSLIISIPHP